MRLHRYFGSHADVTLRDRRLLVSKPSSFNDPFELIHRHVGDWTADKVVEILERAIPLREAKSHVATMAIVLGQPVIFNASDEFGHLCYQQLAHYFVNGNPQIPPVDMASSHAAADMHLRIACFSRTDVTPQSEILLWSHYAKNHSGVRIEFEFDDDHTGLFPVIYEKERLPVHFIDYVLGGGPTDFVKNLMRWKFDAWEYEREVRMVLETDQNARDNPAGLCFFEFEPHMIKGVDFGINCPDETKTAVLDLLEAVYPGVLTRQAVRHPSEFKIDYVTVAARDLEDKPD